MTDKRGSEPQCQLLHYTLPPPPPARRRDRRAWNLPPDIDGAKHSKLIPKLAEKLMVIVRHPPTIAGIHPNIWRLPCRRSLELDSLDVLSGLHTRGFKDFTPIISYSGSGGSDWTAGSSQNDSSINKYSDSSYMVTQVVNASVSFTFFGSGLQLYGAERPNHGLYQVTIDSHIYPPVNGDVSAGQEVFQAPLFQTAALKSGFHKLTVVNLGSLEFDLDFLSWQTPIGEEQETLLSFTFQDSDSSFQYTPASAWSTNPPNIGTFNGGSGHVTSTAGAYVEYTFTCMPGFDIYSIGPVVEIFGPVGPQGAPYSVQLDNGAATNYSSSNPIYHPQTMLFQAANLSSGAHTVRLTSEAWNNSALTLGIDYAQVFSTPSLQPKPSFGTGNILAIVFGILLALSLIATGYLLFSRRRGRPPKDTENVTPFQTVEYDYLGPPTTSPGLQEPTPHTSMQSSNFAMRAADSKTSNEVIYVNPQPISYPQDRKYRPDLEPVRVSSQVVETANTSSPRSFSHASDTTDQERSPQEITTLVGKNVLLRPSGAAPPIYLPE